MEEPSSWAYPGASRALAEGGRHRPVSVFDPVSEGDKLRAAREGEREAGREAGHRLANTVRLAGPSLGEGLPSPPSLQAVSEPRLYRAR